MDLHPGRGDADVVMLGANRMAEQGAACDAERDLRTPGARRVVAAVGRDGDRAGGVVRPGDLQAVGGADAGRGARDVDRAPVCVDAALERELIERGEAAV